MAFKLLSSGRWRNLETGRFAKAPVEVTPGVFVAEGKTVEVILPAYKSVTREYQISKVQTSTAAKAAGKPVIMTGEEFNARYGNLPPVEVASSEAKSFKRGVVNMGVVKQAGRANQIKLRKMDADKLLVLYNENPTMFDLYFAYEGESNYQEYDNEETDILEHVIEMYEKRYGVKL
jgi:hypothetical protein